MKGATLAGCGALALWASLALLSRMAAGVPPLQLTTMAFAVGGTASLLVVAARGQLAALRQPPLVWLHGIGGLFGYHTLYFAALTLAPTIEANLLNYLWPLLIVLLSAPLLNLPLSPKRLLGVGLGFAGSALLVGAGASFPPGALAGFALAAAAALTWALYSVLSRRMAAVPTEAVAGSCLGAAGLAALAHVGFEITVPLGTQQIVVVLLLGLGPMGTAFFLWDVGMKRGDPQLLGTLAYAVPVASTLLLLTAGVAEPSARIVAAALLVAGGGWLSARA